MSHPIPSSRTPSGSELPLHKSAQRLRWFVKAFTRQIRQIEAQTGNVFDVDRDTLPVLFADWIRDFESQKPRSNADNRAYVGFAAGLMLRALVRHRPVAVAQMAKGADLSNPAYFWPEGYLYVAFCLNVRGLVLEADFDAEEQPDLSLNDTGTWWSFRENVEADPTLAIAFLDFFAGADPDWTMPNLFRSGRMTEIARRFYTRNMTKTPTA